MEPISVIVEGTNWAAWLSAGGTIFAATVALVIPFIMDSKQKKRDLTQRKESQKVALKVIYPELEQLGVFFSTVYLHLMEDNFQSLKRLASGEADVDPQLPATPASGRMELVSWLGPELAGYYTISLDRRARLLVVLQLFLSQCLRTDGFGQPSGKSDNVNCQMYERHIKKLIHEGGNAAAHLCKLAEEIDSSLKYSGVKVESPKERSAKVDSEEN